MEVSGFEESGQTPPEHREGAVAKNIEQQTTKVPSDVFLWAAFASIGGSLAFQLARENHAALFVGQWAPTLLILGLYNKLVKLQGSEVAAPSQAEQ